MHKNWVCIPSYMLKTSLLENQPLDQPAQKAEERGKKKKWLNANQMQTNHPILFVSLLKKKQVSLQVTCNRSTQRNKRTI